MGKESYLSIKVLEKRLDIFSASKLKEELYALVENHKSKNIVLDIRNCSYCDASGLNIMVYVHQSCKRVGKNLVITGILPNVEKLIHICKLHYLFMIAKDVDEENKILCRIA